MSPQSRRLRDAETQRKSKYLRVSASLRLVIVSAILVVMTITLSAQIRPTPQAPPRRTAPPPKTAPQPKRESPEPEDKKPAEREGPAPQQPAPQQVSSDPNANAGAALYKKNGCYECHVNDAQGGPQGPRLGPNPIPLPRFVAYVRNPAGDMPPFTAKVISDDDLAKIYAFLQSRPAPPQVKDIPLLAP
jgi:mono/diheme cytochrome c family protein